VTVALAARLAVLHVLADDDPRWKWDPVEQARAACEGGAGVVQLRAKRAGDRVALDWARAIRRVTRDRGVLFFVNDRFDLACLAEADGVHLGQTDLPPTRLPVAATSRLQVGRSTHDPAQARAAAGEPVDYIAFGPVFGTRSKHTEHDARGLPLLARVAALVAPRPLIAIGGIDVNNARAVLEAGAQGLAVISAVAGADDPVGATRALVAQLPRQGTR
jgi:thiamine-phosphate pyrophosphorylase